jgi:hypothetical protein
MIEERYARWLEWITRLGLAGATAAFVAYVAGWLPRDIPLEALPSLWTLPLDRYVAATGAAVGWAWLEAPRGAEHVNLLAVGFLAAAPLICYAVIAITFARAGQAVSALIAVLQVVVLACAASGMAS